MHLLANQLTLSSVQVKVGRNQQALTRLITTQQTYPESITIGNNLSVIRALQQGVNQPDNIDKGSCPQTQGQGVNQTLKQGVNQPGNKVKGSCSQAFQQLILANPLCYVAYYNLFNLKVQEGDLPCALRHLVQSISALFLNKALQQRSQKLVDLIMRQNCSQSILIYLIKAIIHVQNQKYDMAVSDLYWLVDKFQNTNQKIQILNLIKLVYKALGETEKQHSADKDISQLAEMLNLQDLHIYPQRLLCNLDMPNQQPQLSTQLQKRLRQFAELLKQNKQCRAFKILPSMDRIVFKQINNSDLEQPIKNTLSALIQRLKIALLQSPLLNKNQTKVLSRRSKKSDNFPKNESQESIFSSMQGTVIQTLQSTDKQTRSHAKNLTMSNIKFRQNINKSGNLQYSVQLIQPLNTSEVRAKKKIQKIYPLQRQNQQAEIRLIMAQITNNKQLMGAMDPYCILTYNQQHKKSTTNKKGGLQPNWKESFWFLLAQTPQELSIQLYDKENFFKRDNFVGRGKCIVEKNGFLKIQLYDQKNEQAGIVFVTVQAKN